MDMAGRKRWRIAPVAPKQLFEQLAPLTPVVIQVLYNRGLTDSETITAFLNGTWSADNPFVLKDMTAAVTLIRKTVTRHGKIVVYGDYDVDGVTASAILVQTLQSLGAHVKAYIPSRADEGYGLNRDALAALAEEGTQLLITVDCGIRSLDEIALARRLGMAVIITDHHHIGQALPVAEAVINPRRADCPYPFKDLAGAGVAFKLAQALLRTNRKVSLATTQQRLEEHALLDLVALGTVADMVPLLGENHALVLQGLTDINAARRPGINALLEVAGIEPGKINSSVISFTLAPRLNAAGRIREAMTALDLLLAPDMSHALPLAQELDALNRERQILTQEVQERARAAVMAQHTAIPALLMAAAADFPSGVVGLAASRLVDEFYRPAVVISIEGEFSKGSARSIPEFHMTQALDTMTDLLVRHGGHAAAAGFTVRTEHLPIFQARLETLAHAQLSGLTLTPTYQVDAVIPLHHLSWELYHDLARLQPFGYGNATPVFVSPKVRVLNARSVGTEGRHLKLFLGDARGQTWDAIAFRQGEWLARLPRVIDIAYMFEANEWNGNVNLQLNVQDIHQAGEKNSE